MKKILYPFITLVLFSCTNQENQLSKIFETTIECNNIVSPNKFGFQEIVNNYEMIMLETNKFLTGKLFIGNDVCRLIANKKTAKSIVIKGFTYGAYKPFELLENITSSDSSSFYGTLSAVVIDRIRTTDPINEKEIPQKYINVKDVFNNIKIDDNPVIIKYSFNEKLF